MLRPSAKRESTITVDSYLGFTIAPSGTGFMAVPNGWTGEPIWADTEPLVRRAIWCWWNHVELCLPSKEQ